MGAAAVKREKEKEETMNNAKIKRAAAMVRFENLETRRLFAVAVDASGVLTVDGTADNDTITVGLKAGDSATYVVTTNGAAEEIAVADVTGGIRISGGDGDDS